MTEQRDSYVLNVNPEPWKVPPFSPGRQGGKLIVVPGRDEANAAYQEAVRESLREQGAEMREPPYHLHMIFWRQLATYETADDGDETKKWSDSTNMQKLTEDACQGVIISNDKHVRWVSSQIAEQGPDVQPTVAIFLTSGVSPTWLWIPPGFDGEENFIVAKRFDFKTPTTGFDNSWPPK